jgi:O-antigen/teichoic acid export membrane protein
MTIVRNQKLSKLFVLFKGKLVGNSFWAILSSVFQSIIFSLFFIVIARRYSSSDFSSYIIANTLYGMILSFSSLGLSQWFIREIKQHDFEGEIISRFFKIQLLAGAVFYLFNVLLSFTLYSSDLVRNISLLLGINIIFDNIIYVFKTINISKYEQKRSFVLTSVEAIIKLVLAAFVVYLDISIFSVIVMLVIFRGFTLYLFFRFGLSDKIDIAHYWKGSLALREIGLVLKKNIYFIVIGSVSVVYWSTGSLLVSKLLQLDKVADYEISFKLFSMAEILPVMVSASVFPILVEKGKADVEERNRFFRKVFLVYAMYGLLAFTFVYSYAALLIPFLFGAKYIHTVPNCIQMFWTIIIFPTALLQANLLVAMHMEKTDMWLNLLSLALNFIISFFGLTIFQDIAVVNYAIFISFLFFHISQDIILVQYGIHKQSGALFFYISSALLLLAYHFLSAFFSDFYFFFLFWSIFGLVSLVYTKTFLRDKAIAA